MGLRDIPLWNFSSIGGIIFRTLRRISRVLGDILGDSPGIGITMSRFVYGVVGWKIIMVGCCGQHE